MDRTPRTKSGQASRRPHLQIAVLGDSIAGLTFGALLQERGFDPVITTNPNQQLPSQISTIWNAGQRILGTLGIDDTVNSAGRTLERLWVHSSGTAEGFHEVLSPTIEYPHPVVRSTATLKESLRNRLDDQPIDASVSDLYPKTDSVTVEFEHGVREEFDLVVDARHPEHGEQTSASRDFQEGTALLQHEISVPAHSGLQSTAVEGWFDGVLMQRLPSPPTADHAFLRTTARTEHDLSALFEQFRESLLEAGIDLGPVEFQASDAIGEKQSLLVSQPPRDSLHTDRRVLLGPSARHLPPASGSAVSLGLEDAWVLADEIATGPDDPQTIGKQYERRRQKRNRAIQQRAESARRTHSYPIPADEPERTIGHFRSAALGSFCSDALAELQQRYLIDG